MSKDHRYLVVLDVDSTLINEEGLDEIARAVDEGFRPSPSALCAWCAFHDYCPSQGGTTPALPDVG